MAVRDVQVSIKNQYKKSKDKRVKTFSLDKVKFSQETCYYHAAPSWFWGPEPMSTQGFAGFAHVTCVPGLGLSAHKDKR